MRRKEKASKQDFEAEIDHIVVAQADDDSAWEAQIHVQHAISTALALPVELAARAALMARLHRQKSVEEWLRHIIEERFDVEETIYGEVKREMAPKQTRKVVRQRLSLIEKE